MMNKLEEAVIYATIMHQGEARKFKRMPYILHPMEVAQILSTMTDDEDVITAGMLHDIVEDTDGTLGEIKKRFGERVAFLVSAESERSYADMERGLSWQRRKEESLNELRNNTDLGVRMLWLADKLANIRSLASAYSERGEAVWQELNQSDPEMQRWYYRSIAEQLELSLNRTGAFKELIKHINSIWPGTFDSDKARYRKYREVSVEGCKRIGHGAKGEVYRYDNELVIKVYNQNNTYRDVEQEIALARKAFILGIPTAISFGIVSVGERYGAMYELVDSETISRLIASNPRKLDYYAHMMADLAHTIHSIEVSEEDGFPPITNRLHSYIETGLAHEDEALAEKCLRLIDTMPVRSTLLHGDFHTGNVFLQKGEPLLIDMDRLSTGNPLVEISDLYYCYVILGEDDPAVVENFMGFSYKTAGRFFRSFLKHYLGTDDEDRLRRVTEAAAFLSYPRMIRKIRKKGQLSGEDRAAIARCLAETAALAEKLDTLDLL